MNEKVIFINHDMIKEATAFIRQREPAFDATLILSEFSLIQKALGDSTAPKDQKYYFSHLSFQEYFAARYIAHQLQRITLTPEGEIPKDCKIAEFIIANKSVKGMELTLSFIAGILKQENKSASTAAGAGASSSSADTNILNTYFKLLFTGPNEVGELELPLLFSCLNQAEADPAITDLNTYQKDLLFQALTSINSDFRADMLVAIRENCPHLFNVSLIKEFETELRADFPENLDFQNIWLEIKTALGDREALKHTLKNEFTSWQHYSDISLWLGKALGRLNKEDVEEVLDNFEELMQDRPYFSITRMHTANLKIWIYLHLDDAQKERLSKMLEKLFPRLDLVNNRTTDNKVKQRIAQAFLYLLDPRIPLTKAMRTGIIENLFIVLDNAAEDPYTLFYATRAAQHLIPEHIETVIKKFLALVKNNATNALIKVQVADTVSDSLLPAQQNQFAIAFLNLLEDSNPGLRNCAVKALCKLDITDPKIINDIYNKLISFARTEILSNDIDLHLRSLTVLVKLDLSPDQREGVYRIFDNLLNRNYISHRSTFIDILKEAKFTKEQIRKLFIKLIPAVKEEDWLLSNAIEIWLKKTPTEEEISAQINELLTTLEEGTINAKKAAIRVFHFNHLILNPIQKEKLKKCLHHLINLSTDPATKLSKDENELACNALSCLCRFFCESDTENEANLTLLLGLLRASSIPLNHIRDELFRLNLRPTQIDEAIKKLLEIINNPSEMLEESKIPALETLMKWHGITHGLTRAQINGIVENLLKFINSSESTISEKIVIIDQLVSLKCRTRKHADKIIPCLISIWDSFHDMDERVRPYEYIHIINYFKELQPVTIEQIQQIFEKLLKLLGLTSLHNQVIVHVLETIQVLKLNIEQKAQLLTALAPLQAGVQRHYIQTKALELHTYFSAPAPTSDRVTVMYDTAIQATDESSGGVIESKDDDHIVIPVAPTPGS